MLPSFLGIVAQGGGGGGCPAYGTVLFNQNEIYPISEGGSTAYYDIYSFPSQTCDVNYIADGSCGQLIDWTSASNIQFLPLNYFYQTITVNPIDNSYQNSLNAGLVDTSSAYWTLYDGNYYKEFFSKRDLFASGTGTVNAGSVYDSIYWPSGLQLTTDFGPYMVEVPSGSGNYFNNGIYDTYTVAANQTDYDTTQTGSLYPNGTFITNDGGTDYYWNGSGGYYS